MKRHSDRDRVTLFYYILQVGLPPWAQGKDEHKAIAALCGWDDERAIAAREDAAIFSLLDAPAADPATVDEVDDDE